MKLPLKILISQAKRELDSCAPKHRDRIRRRLIQLERAAQIRREMAA